MKRNRKNGGFTLVELIVTIAVGSVITLAATTVLLLGLRVNNQSTETVQNQNTTRILLSALEDMASEGTITEIEDSANAWKIKSGNKILYYYEAGTIYTGTTPILENVIASSVLLNDNLLTVAVETEHGAYSSAVYCRVVPKNESTDSEGDKVVGNLTDDKTDNDEIVVDSNAGAGRNAFLKILASQYRLKGGSVNHGVILQDGKSTGKYYSQWYSSNWSKDTPWCACFVSWAISGLNSEYLSGVPKYANVDSFAEYFRENKDGSQWKERTAYTPIAGDLIFFDWDGDNDLQHVGVVLAVSDGYVYTIEGNTADMVAVRKYAVTDTRIAGYGVLPWKTPDSTSG